MFHEQSARGAVIKTSWCVLVGDDDPGAQQLDPHQYPTGVRPSDVKGDNRAHGNRDPGDAGGGVPVARGLPVRGDLHP